MATPEYPIFHSTVVSLSPGTMKTITSADLVALFRLFKSSTGRSALNPEVSIVATVTEFIPLAPPA